jgi:hypothetical protein
MDPELVLRRDAALAARREAERLDSEFKAFQLWFQQTQCSHERYTATSDGDCHSPGYYYTCDRCGHWTSRRPGSGTVVHASIGR